MSPALAPGAVIGILGGGQLGSFLVASARSMGYRVHVFSPEACSPAGTIADREIVGDWGDAESVRAFAAGVAVLTVETEAAPWRSLAAAEEVTLVRPGSQVLRWTQNRLEQRAFLRDHGFPVGPYRPVLAPGDAALAARELGLPLYLKLAETGYDGRGQVRVAVDGDTENAWAALGQRPAISEGLVPFSHEFTIILARGADGNAVCFPPIETLQREGVLDVAWAPASISASMARAAEAIARGIGESAGLVGLLCVECYALADGTVLVNEAAARPHNAGHLTIEACACSQFEQLVRAVSGLPLGRPELRSPAAMANILGGHTYTAPSMPSLSGSSVFVHDYGKQPRDGRKLGHVAVNAPSVELAQEAAIAVRAKVCNPTS